jgi:hypothetical protein
MRDLKLYNQFCEVLDGFDKDLHLALMTTFDFNTQLIERYILSRLAGLSYKEVKTKGDYEIINSNLNEVDVGVFYHFNAPGDDEPKKTTVPFLGVNPKNLGAKFGENSLFHAKVMLLQDQDFTTYLLTGSANLTFGGWGNNIESFYVRKVDDKANARRIIRFFKSLYPANSGEQVVGQKLDAYESNLDRLNLNESNSEWQFHTFINDSQLLPDFKQFSNSEALYFWSPYYSSDLKHTISQVQEAGFQNIYLIPDQSHGQVKISQENLTQLEKLSELQFMEDRQFAGYQDTLVHAKCMLSNNSVGIGSWNFTRSALQLQHGNHNVEAGVFIKLNDDESEKLRQPLKNKALAEIKGMDTQELEEEQVRLNDFSFYCTIAADWKTYGYRLLFPDMELIDGHFKIWLPANENEKDWLPLKDVEAISFKQSFKSLYQNKHFIIWDTEKEAEVFRGLLIETGKTYRPVYQYETLNDVFISVLQEKDDIDHTRAKTIISQVDEQDDQSGGNIRDFLDDGSSNKLNLSWYNLFDFFKKIRKRIESIDDTQKLIQQKQQRPDSIENILKLISEYVHYYLENEQKRTVQTLPYCWFLLKEANDLVSAYNLKVKDLNHTKEQAQLDNQWIESLAKQKEQVTEKIIAQEATDHGEVRQFLTLIERDYYENTGRLFENNS